jgi:hypothetical protein
MDRRPGEARNEQYEADAAGWEPAATADLEPALLGGLPLPELLDGLLLPARIVVRWRVLQRKREVLASDEEADDSGRDQRERDRQSRTTDGPASRPR